MTSTDYSFQNDHTVKLTHNANKAKYDKLHKGSVYCRAVEQTPSMTPPNSNLSIDVISQNNCG